VEVNGNSNTGWWLPTTPGTTKGFTTEGEIEHLYSVEFNIELGKSLTDANKGPFTWLQPNAYWTGTEYAAADTVSWAFNFAQGSQLFPKALGDERQP